MIMSGKKFRSSSIYGDTELGHGERPEPFAYDQEDLIAALARVLAEWDITTPPGNVFREVLIPDEESRDFAQAVDILCAYGCETRWLGICFWELVEIVEDKQSWDTAGSSEVDLLSVRATFRLLISLSVLGMPKPEIVVLPHGLIQLGWLEADVDMEILVTDGDNIVSFCTFTEDKHV